MNWSLAARYALLAAGLSIVSSCSDDSAPVATDRAVRLSLYVGDFSGSSVELGPGASAQVNADVFDAAGDPLEHNGPLTIVSRDTTVARIDSNNRIYAISPGNTVVFGSLQMDGGTLTDSITFTVINAPPSAAARGR
jgi:hypothetical protein